MLQNAVMSKLEKADILEMTIEYIHSMHALQGNQAVEPQYTTGFNECTAHVANYISSVGLNDEGISSEDLSTRLLEHLVSVTTSKDLQVKNKQLTLTEYDQGAQEYNADDSKHILTDMDEKVTGKTEVGHVGGANGVKNSTVTMNSSGTITIPKKRKVLANYTNFADMQDKNEYTKRSTKTVSTPHFGGVELKVRSPSKSLRGKESKCVPKPIKKRLSALASKPVDTTSGQRRSKAVADNFKVGENGSIITGCRAIADGCNVSESGSIQRAEKPDSVRGLHTAEISIRELEYTNQVEQTNYSDLLSNGSLCYAETGIDTIHPLNWPAYENHTNEMSVQPENDLSKVNALQHAMYERYEEKTTSQMHFTYDSVPSTAETDSDNSYLFYQHYFANNNTENVWRPW